MSRNLPILVLSLAGLTGCGGISPDGQDSTLSDHRDGMPCFYDGDDFEVIYDGRRYSESADDDFAHYALDCGESIAALYDGDYFRIFNGKTKRFDWDSADDDYTAAKLAVGDTVAGLYDGDYFRIYNVETGRFDWDSADDNYEDAVLDAYGDLVVMYDGDYVRSYSGGRFDWDSADDNFAGAEVVAGKGGALVYDGDYIRYFCQANGRWNWESADDNVAARAHRGSDDRPAMMVGDDYYYLDTQSCRLRQI